MLFSPITNLQPLGMGSGLGLLHPTSLPPLDMYSHKPKRVEEGNDAILGPRVPSSSGKPMVLELLSE